MNKKNKKDIIVKIEKISSYNPKNVYNMLFEKKSSQMKKATYDILEENIINDDYEPTEQQIKQEILELLSTLPALEVELEDKNLKLSNSEMLRIIKRFNNSIYFFFTYYYKKGFLEDFDPKIDYFK